MQPAIIRISSEVADLRKLQFAYRTNVHEFENVFDDRTVYASASYIGDQEFISRAGQILNSLQTVHYRFKTSTKVPCYCEHYVAEMGPANSDMLRRNIVSILKGLIFEK